MDSTIQLTELADVRAFFTGSAAASAERFTDLYAAFHRAYESRPREVVDRWLPYTLEQLEAWPDDFRKVEWYVDKVDRLLTEPHPLHALLRCFYMEEWQPDEVTPCLRRLVAAPDFGVFTMLSASWEKDSLGPDELRELFSPARGLRELEISCHDFGDAHAAALAECPGLELLRSLSVQGHVMSAVGIRALSGSPHLRGLARFLLAESEEDLHWIVNADASGCEDRLTPSQTLELSNSMPNLEMLLATGGTRSMEEVAKLPPIESEPVPAVRERVLECLNLYRLPNQSAAYPFDGVAAASFLVELDPQQMADPNLSLEELVPAHTDYHEWTRVYGLGIEAGALEKCFDPQGALSESLRLRCFGRGMDAPEARDKDYQGQCVHQSLFASAGLCLDEDEQGLLWLYPHNHERGTDLVVFYRALNEAQRIYGGCNVEFACTPWHEIMGCVCAEYGRRSIVHWPESGHAFDRRGDLPAGQAQVVGARGDLFPLRNVLARYGLELVPHAGHDVALRRRVDSRDER